MHSSAIHSNCLIPISRKHSYALLNVSYSLTAGNHSFAAIIINTNNVSVIYDVGYPLRCPSTYPASGSMPLVVGLLRGDVQPLHRCQPKPTTTSQRRVVGKIHPQPTNETRHEIHTPDSTEGGVKQMN